VVAGRNDAPEGFAHARDFVGIGSCASTAWATPTAAAAAVTATVAAATMATATTSAAAVGIPAVLLPFTVASRRRRVAELSVPCPDAGQRNPLGSLGSALDGEPGRYQEGDANGQTDGNHWTHSFDYSGACRDPLEKKV